MISTQAGTKMQTGWGQTSQVEAMQAMETKDDFGNAARRTMYSNSGSFHKFESIPQTKAMEAQKVMPVVNFDWEHYKGEAETAAKYGNSKKAEAMWLASLEVAERFSNKDPRLAYSLDNVASIFAATGNLGRAEVYCKRALEVSEEIYGKTHLKTANCINNLAGIYYNQRRFSEAESLCVSVLTTYNKLLGPDHADVGMAANNLAMLYHAQGKYGLAELLYERALPIRKKSLGKAHPVVTALMENYANVLSQMGRHEKSQAVRSDLKSSGVWHLFESRVPLFQVTA